MKTLREIITYVNKVLKDDYERPVIGGAWSGYDEEKGRKLNSLWTTRDFIKDIINEEVSECIYIYADIYADINRTKIIINHDMIIFTTKRKQSDMSNRWGNSEMTVVEIKVDKGYEHLLDKDIVDVVTEYKKKQAEEKTKQEEESNNKVTGFIKLLEQHNLSFEEFEKIKSNFSDLSYKEEEILKERLNVE